LLVILKKYINDARSHECQSSTFSFVTDTAVRTGSSAGHADISS